MECFIGPKFQIFNLADMKRTKLYRPISIHTYIHTYLARHPYIELGLAIVFLSCAACKPEKT